MKLRDKQLAKLIIDYQKDVVHFKEMKLGSPDAEIIEVKYFDQEETLDETTRQILNMTIKDTKFKFEQKLQEARRNYARLQARYDDLKKELDAYEANQDRQVEAVQGLVRLLDGDLYRFWKLIQTAIGNRPILTVLVNQQKGYGINYDEICMLLSQGRFNDKDFAMFKEQMTRNYEELKQTTLVELEHYKQKYQDQIALVRDLEIKQSREMDLVRQKIESDFLLNYQEKENKRKNRTAEGERERDGV